MNKDDAFQQAFIMSAQSDDIVLVIENNCDGCDVMLEEEYLEEYLGESVGNQVPARYLHSELIV